MIEISFNYELVLVFASMSIIALVTHLTKSILFKSILFVLSIITVVHFINTAPNQALVSYITLSTIVDDINTHTYTYSVNALYTMSYELVLIIVFTYMTFMLYKIYNAIRHMLT